MTHLNHGFDRKIRATPKARVTELLSANAVFLQKKAGDTFKRVPPPAPVVDGVLARGYWSIPELHGVTSIPVLTGTGRMLLTPGYDPESRLLYLPNHGPLSIPDHPGHADAVKAAQRLLDPVQDFPFAAESDRVAFLAGLLTLFGRHMISGPTPFFLVMANIRSAGKTMLVEVLGQIVLGTSIPRLPHTTDAKEEQQQIFSTALAGHQVVLLDNIEGKIGSAAFNSMLTSSTIQGRVFHSQQLRTVPMDAVWFGTGNNPVLHPDLARRSIVIQLRTDDERPELRTRFKYPNLVDHLRNHRELLISDCITILKAFLLAKVPRQLTRGMGSYESWDRLIREALYWVLKVDPCERTIRGECQHDTEREALIVLMLTWKAVYPEGGGHHVSAFVDRLYSKADLPVALLSAIRELSPRADREDSSGQSLARSLGYVLRRYQDRPIQGHRFVQHGTKDRNGIRWELTPIDDEVGGISALVGRPDGIDSIPPVPDTPFPVLTHADWEAHWKRGGLTPARLLQVLQEGVAPGVEVKTIGALCDGADYRPEDSGVAS